jgi:ribonuclease HII
VEEIDQLNILQATMLAMQRAVTVCVSNPARFWWWQTPAVAQRSGRSHRIGDALALAISAASTGQ